MTITEKVDILYRKATGGKVSRSEKEEVRKYKVSSGCGEFLATKKNLRAYVKEVDDGTTSTSFDTWCLNRGLADARRKGGDKKSMKERANVQARGGTLLGGLFLSVAMTQALPVPDSPIIFLIGCIIAYVLNRFFRRKAFIVDIILAMIIVQFFGK